MKEAVRSGPGAGTIVKRFLIGRQKPSHQLEHQRLPKVLALPIFASDALSSNAYATEQILLVLLTASATGVHSKVIPIALVIAVLLAVVVASYAQVCRAYPGGGGGYVVTRDTLGRIASLVAAAALLVDLVLTVAVSVVAGVVAVISYQPSLLRFAIPLSLGFVVLLTVANLRGVRESGALFAVPTYLFIVSILIMIAVGFVDCLAGGCPRVEPVPPLEYLATGPGLIGMFVLLHAFSSGATALTGVEAIATAVPAFQRPQARNAQRTLVMMGALSITMFLGISYLAANSGARASEHRSVVAQIAHAVFDGGPGFLLVQIFTTLILVLAANTSYQAFPRLLAIIAQDRYMPRRFAAMGDRLVFSNGIILLAVAAALLIWAFDANLDQLIQLYVVGVFTDFTLSQTGMIRRWLRVRRQGTDEARGWQYRIAINAVGAVCTAGVLAVTVVTKFTEGAWIVVVAIPLIVALLDSIHRHYVGVDRQLRMAPEAPRAAENHVVLLVPDAGPATAEALGYVRSFRPADLRAVYIGDGAESPEAFEERWHDFARGGIPLDLIPANGDLLDRVRGYVRSVPRAEGDFVTVVLPELVSEGSLMYLVRRTDLVRLKARMLREPGVVVTDVPVHTQGGALVGVDGRPLVPRRTVALVLVAGVHAATARAVSYAESLRATETRAVTFMIDASPAEAIQQDWYERGFGVALDLIQAPFRELREPLLEEVRSHVVEEDTVVAVVMPELLAAHWWQTPLHNQTALLVKRALLFEPRVILSSVPYQLR
jgi:amino acid transporter